MVNNLAGVQTCSAMAPARAGWHKIGLKRNTTPTPMPDKAGSRATSIAHFYKLIVAWRARRLLIAEEFGLSLAHLTTLLCVAPQFHRPITRKASVPTADGFVHRRGNLAQVVDGEWMRTNATSHVFVTAFHLMSPLSPLSQPFSRQRERLSALSCEKTRFPFQQ